MTSTRLLGAALLAIATCFSATAEELETEQILVTATRLPADGRSMALGWRALNEDAIDLTAAVHINEVMQRVPNVWISRGNGQEHLTALRSPVLTGAGSCGAFFMAADGISLRAPGFCNVNQLFDSNFEQAGRIEIIKGPATALFGSNALHGVINIMSAAPPPEFDHALSFEVGPHDYYRAKYRVGDQRGDHAVSLRLNATDDGGYKDDSGYEQQKLTLRHDYSGERFDTVTVVEGSNLNQDTAGFIRGFEAYKDPARKRSNPNPEAYRDARSWRLYSTITTELNDANTLAVTPYLRHNEMEFLMHFLPWQPVEENGHSSLGLRATLHTEGERYRLVSGVDLEYTEGWLKETQDQPFSPNQPVGIHYDYKVDASLAAAYAQLSYALSGRLDLDLGARLEYNHYDYSNLTEDGPACAPGASACRFYRPANRSDSFTNPALNGGLNWAFHQDHRIFLRLAHGFRAPQAAELYRLQAGQQVADLDAEQLTNFEVGVRGTLWDSLGYDASAWQMRKRDVIFQDANRQNVSGAKTRHHGIDLALDYQPAGDWYAGLDLGWARHRYDSDIMLIGSSGDIKGNDIDTAPRLFGSARVGWLTADTLGLDGQVELEWVYMDSYYLEPDNQYEYEGHSLLNLRYSTELTRRLHGSLRITNLLDEDYAERADFGFGDYRYFVGQPRGVYAELSYQFGVI